MKNRVLLLTGGLGFIGSKLLFNLEENYDRILIVDSLHPFVHKNLSLKISSNITLVSGKVEDARTWEYAFERLNFELEFIDVIHLASETSTGLSLSHPSWHTNPNINGTSYLMEFLDLYPGKVRRVILSSSRAVYGEGAWSQNENKVYPAPRRKVDLEGMNWSPIYNGNSCDYFLPSSASDTLANPCNVYGATKLSQELLLKIWGSAHDVQIIILRFQNVYGPGQSLDNGYSGVLAFFVKEALNGRQLNVFEDGEIVRDFVFVDDVIGSLTAAVKTSRMEAFVGDIGTGSASTLFEAADVISNYLAIKSPSRVNNFRTGDVRAAVCDPTKTKEFLDKACTTSLSEGLISLVEWAKEEINL